MGADGSVGCSSAPSTAGVQMIGAAEITVESSGGCSGTGDTSSNSGVLSAAGVGPGGGVGSGGSATTAASATIGAAFDHRRRRLDRFGLDRFGLDRLRRYFRGRFGDQRQRCGCPGCHPTRLRCQQQADGHVVLRMRAQGQRALELLLQQIPDDRHPAAAADQHDRREVGRLHSGTTQHPRRHGDALPDGGPDQRLELAPSQPYLRRIAGQRHGDRRLRFGRQVLLGLGAAAAHLRQSRPGLRVVGFQVAAAITESAQHEPEDRLVEVGPGRVLGAFALAEGPEARSASSPARSPRTTRRRGRTPRSGRRPAARCGPRTWRRRLRPRCSGVPGPGRRRRSPGRSTPVGTRSIGPDS